MDFSKMKQIGDNAPEFTLEDKEGNALSLSSINGWKIVYFYPKDNTLGCTVQAKGFEKLKSEFDKLNVPIIGISGGDKKSKEKFCSSNNLTFILLMDADFKVSREYGVYGKKKFMGREFMGISRTTFVIDGNNKIKGVFEKADVKTNPSEVLTFIKKSQEEVA